MNGNLSEIRSQLEQEVACERALYKARRQPRQPLWQSLRRWWLPASAALTAIFIGHRARNAHYLG
jgi:hypothetical protein